MYIGLAHTGIGAAILTVAAITSVVARHVTRLAARRRAGDGR
ncbi:hypothetical protein ACWF95_38425 [Streptomyces vinaceus]